jgi:hypothetical protein
LQRFTRFVDESLERPGLDVTLTGLYETFAVNTFGPLVMAKHFAPLLMKGRLL